MSQVIIYLKWMRYLIDVTLRDKVYVVLNVDETSLNSLVESNGGYVCDVLRDGGQCAKKPLPKKNRANAKTTLVGVVADQGALQPYLPQVIMPKYTQKASPPAWLRASYAQQGFPLQYWHGTSGTSTPQTFIRWLSVVRSAVHSFNEDIWILLIMDCHSTHLDLRVLRHLGRLGILTVIVPAKLTWLLQPLDVYVYADLKRELRQHLAEATLNSSEDQVERGSWITPTATAIRSVLVRTDWSKQFDRLGAGLDIEAMRGEVASFVAGAVISPALPKSTELAQILHRRPETGGTKRLHAALTSPAIRVRDLPGDAKPPRGAYSHLPVMPASMKRRKMNEEPDVPLDVQIREYLVRHSSAVPLGGIVGPEARQITFEASRAG